MSWSHDKLMGSSVLVGGNIGQIAVRICIRQWVDLILSRDHTGRKPQHLATRPSPVRIGLLFDGTPVAVKPLVEGATVATDHHPALHGFEDCRELFMIVIAHLVAVVAELIP